MKMIKTGDVQEIWKKIPESDKFYEISNLGRVRNGDTKRILTPRPTKTGYLRVHISVGNGRKDFYIHRLVAEAFCNHPTGCDVVNHLDNDPSNNAATNLEWITQRQNVEYAQKQKRMQKWPDKKPVIGYKNGQTYYFESIIAASKALGFYSSDISRCCRGLRDNTDGYIWEYASEVINNDNTDAINREVSVCS